MDILENISSIIADGLKTIGGWADLATIVGIIIALVSYRGGKENMKKGTEQANAPDFFFTAPNQCTRFGVGYCSGGDFLPTLNKACDGKKTVYWFNLVNCGKFAARDVEVLLLTEKEIYNLNIVKEERWQKITYQGGHPSGEQNGDMIPIETCLHSFKPSIGDEKFYVLLAYTSNFSGIRYKRVYEWKICDKIPIDLLTSNYDKNHYSIGIGVVGYEYGSYSLDIKLSDEQLLSAVKNGALKTPVDIQEYFCKVALDRPVSLHDVRLTRESNSKSVHLLTKIRTKLHERISKSISMEEWLRKY